MGTGILAYLLNDGSQDHRPVEPSERDHAVAATVIQWLGSPVGQGFLNELGYARAGGPYAPPTSEPKP